METLAYIYFISCLKATVPNPYQVNYLPEEQKQVIYDYAQRKCQAEVEFMLQGPPENQCNEDGDCA